MKDLIGKRLLKTISPHTKSYDIRDTRLKGFLLRVQPSGHMAYYCEYARGKKFFLGKADAINPDDARERAKQVIADATNGIDPNAVKKASQVHNLKSYIELEYGPWVLNKKSGAATLARLNACFVDPWGKKKLNGITPGIVEKWQTGRQNAGIFPTTINRDVTALKAVLSKAAFSGYLTVSPLAGFKKLEDNRSKRERYLSPEEEMDLREALEAREVELSVKRESANEWRRARGYHLLPDTGAMPFADNLKPMVLLSMNTGMRRGETFHLVWGSVNLSLKTLTVEGETTKTGKERHLPLNEESYSLLSAWQRQTGGTGKTLVFPGRNGAPLDNVRSSWGSLLKRAKIVDFRWHDLRHHFASRLVMAGVDLNTVRELLGHSDIKMTLRYAHLAPEYKANAVAKLTPQIRPEANNDQKMGS